MGDVHDASYYAKCMVGGIFACGITHAAVCPLDIVKCRRQVSLMRMYSVAVCVYYSDSDQLNSKISSFVLTILYFVLGEP